MKKLGFPDTPDSIPSSAPDPVQIARKTKEAQEAHARAVAANERNEQAAEARWRAIQEREEAPRVGYVFAKSCALPDGMINHNNSRGFVPLESLQQYGMYGVLASAGAVSPLGTPLSWVGGSGSASAVAKRLMGQVAVRAPLPVKVVVAVLMPNTTSADSAFYSSEQYAELTKGNTRARVNVKQLPDGSVNLYGFYTGGKTDWQHVPVIKAQTSGEHLIAIKLTGFPDAVIVKSKTKIQGGGGERRRWQDAKGRIYEWDSRHGAVEMYNKQGKHLGEFDPTTGAQNKPAKPGRKVEK